MDLLNFVQKPPLFNDRDVWSCNVTLLGEHTALCHEWSLELRALESEKLGALRCEREAAIQRARC